MKLRAKDCRAFFDAVEEKSIEMGVDVSTAMVGPEGNLIALERMDNAGFITPELAHAKAYTVAAFRSMSPRFPDGLVIQKWFKERNPQMLVNAAIISNGKVTASGGSAPIFQGSIMIGAYAVSGATGDQDEEISEYARQKVGWAKMSTDPVPDDVRDHINEIYAKVGLGHRKL